MRTKYAVNRLSKLAFQASEVRYREIFEHAILGIYRTTPEGTYLEMNPAFAQMYGYDSPDEMMQAIRDIQRQLYVNPEDRVRIKDRLAMDGIVKNFAAEFYKKDGQHIWININAKATRDVSGRILWYEGTTEDITRRKQVEQALRESEQRYRSLSEASPDIIFMIDRNDRVTYVNNTAAEMVGVPPTEIIGRERGCLFPGDISVQQRQAIGKVFETGEQLRSTGKISFGGNPHWFDPRSSLSGTHRER